MNKHNSGFTIVEMAVVVFVIGLLIVGVTAGKNLIEAGRTRAVLGELDDYRQSMLAFQQKYNDWPGDMSDASTYWAGAINGNGDEQITWATEGVQMWRHLELASMIGQTGFSTSITPDAVVGTNVPSSKIVGAGWFVDYSTTMKNHLGLGAQQASGVNNAPALDPKRAFDIDAKVDDGFPSTGQVQSTGNATDCFSGTAYSTDNTSPTCVVRFSIKSN